MTLNAEVSFDTFGKELGLLGASLGSFVTWFKHRIATGGGGGGGGGLRFKKICYLTP